MLTLDFIVWETLASSAIISADFCDQYVQAMNPKQRLVKLDIVNCIPIIWKR